MSGGLEVLGKERVDHARNAHVWRLHVEGRWVDSHPRRGAWPFEGLKHVAAALFAKRVSDGATFRL